MDNIYKVLDRLNQVMEDSAAVDASKMNKQADYKPFGKGDKDYETGLPKNAKKDPVEESDDGIFADTALSMDKLAKLKEVEETASTIRTQLKDAMMSRLAELAGVPLAEIEEAISETPEDAAARIKEGHCEACGCEMAHPDPTCECGASGGKTMVTMDEDEVEEGNEFSGALAQAKKDGKEEFEVDGKTYKVEEAEESDVERDDHAEKAGREVERDAKYDGKKHADKDGKDVTKDIEYDEKHDKDGMHEDFEDEKVCDKCDEKMDDCKCEKVDETTVAGSVAPGADGQALYKNASVYESNEIVRAAGKLMEGMNINISMNDQSGPSLTVNATDEDAMKLGALLKLAGLGNLGMQHDHVHEEQEFANGADDTATADTDTLVNGIAGGLNGPKQQVNPNNPGDNPLAMQNIKNNTVNLGESELEETSASHLMELYKEFKAK